MGGKREATVFGRGLKLGVLDQVPEVDVAIAVHVRIDVVIGSAAPCLMRRQIPAEPL